MKLGSKSKAAKEPTETKVKALSPQKQEEEDEKQRLAEIERALDAIPPQEAEILRQQLQTLNLKSSLFGMYRYCEPIDVVLFLVAAFFAAVEGAALPMLSLIVGAITNNFSDFTTGDTTGSNFQDVVNKNALYFVYLGIGIIGASFIEAYLFVTRGELITARFRKRFLRGIMRQNIAFFDKIGPGAITTRITNDTSSIQEAISEKSGYIVKAIASFIASLIIAFTAQWKLTLIVLCAVFWLMICLGIVAPIFVKNLVASEEVYTVGSNIAEEAFSAARNTVALGAQNKLLARYDLALGSCKTLMLKSNIGLSMMLGVLWSVVAFIYALAFWEGSRLLVRGQVNIGQISVVFTSLLIGAFEISSLAPQFSFVAKGISGAKGISETISRVPIIDSEAEGKRLEQVEGHIKLSNVRFRYPSRPAVLVLPNFSLEIAAGQTVALVGSSGSGKSTIVGLLERFYLPLDGSITLDGVETSTLDLKWLRQQIGYVPQEPTLFSDSIAENIAHGLIGTPYENADVEKQRELVVDACKQANAWDFIQSLDDGLDTNVGERGFLLSGGQKQRIAIARAIVSNPKILLLDEATSALDTKSEGIVQDALDRAAKSRTTIMIAHRLSTVKDADKIVVMAKGEIVESGTHAELINHGGVYANLVELQKVSELVDTDGSDTLTAQSSDLIEDDVKVEQFDPSTLKIPGLEPVDASLGRILKLLWKLNRNERYLLMLGFVFSLTCGYAMTAYSMLIGKSSAAMMVKPDGYSEMRSTINLTSGMFFMIGMHQLIIGFFLILLLTNSAAALLHNVRHALFEQFLRMDISFYDYELNTPGALTSVLAKDGKNIEGLGGATFAQILNCVVMVVGGLITGIAFSWRIGLVGTACIPILLACGYGRLRVLIMLEERSRKVYEKSAGLASAFASAVRTVQSLSREDQVCARYNEIIDAQVKVSNQYSLYTSIVFGFSEGLIPWILALIWWWGSKMLREGKVGVMQYYVVFIGLITGAQAAGQAFNYAPNMGKARSSAGNVMKLLEAKPIIDTWDQSGIIIDESSMRGEIELRNVRFRYPTRPQIPVLRGISLKVQRGQYVALVGASGCGKSTTIGLVERFYDPEQGQVLFDGVDLREHNVNSLRKQIGLVQQEPMLYSGTIRSNVLLGWPDDDTSAVTDEMIHSACLEANIHDYIMTLPDGYETDVGSAGNLLSGGQKQRLAIARVLLRDPTILLLDEATSALDAQAEKAVQQALDNAAKGRTTISIAHRLSTIQHADVIYVFDQGVIVESGTHSQLLSLNGRYSELVKLQSLEIAS